MEYLLSHCNLRQGARRLKGTYKDNCFMYFFEFFGPMRAITGPIWVHMGLYGPIWALMGPYKGPYMGPYGSSWTGRGEGVNFPSTFRKTIWTNLIRFGSKINFLIKFLNDSASFLLEKLKNQVILIQNLNLTKEPKNTPTILKNRLRYMFS